MPGCEAFKVLRHGSHSFTYKLHHVCLFLVSVHQMALPLNCDSVHLTAAYYSAIDPKMMKGWVGLVGWPTADGLPTSVVTRQLWVKHMSGKVCWSKNDVLPLHHAMVVFMDRPEDDIISYAIWGASLQLICCSNSYHLLVCLGLYRNSAPNPAPAEIR